MKIREDSPILVAVSMTWVVSMVAVFIVMARAKYLLLGIKNRDFL